MHVMADTLTPAPEPDRFEHETPRRAFTEWNESGIYAIGKGLRPSVKHLPVYLDAIERKEGWQLVQMLLDDHGSFRSAIFRRDPAKLVERYREAHPGAFEAWLEERQPTLPEGRLAALREAVEKMDQVRAMSDEMDRAMCDETDREKADDPVNPKHYGGTACAEIGERLTANCYQVLKYCWRLGEKDDPKIELGKAIWYARREMALGPCRSRGQAPLPGMKQAFVIERTRDNPWRREIGLLVWDMCYGFGTPLRWHERAEELLQVLEDKLADLNDEAPCTTGLAV